MDVVDSSIYILQENLGNTRNEVERLRGILQTAGSLLLGESLALRQELRSLKSLSSADGLVTSDLLHEVTSKLGEWWAARERQLSHRLTVDHELEMDALKNNVRAEMEAKDEEIRDLKKVTIFHWLCYNKITLGLFKII